MQLARPLAIPDETLTSISSATKEQLEAHGKVTESVGTFSIADLADDRDQHLPLSCAAAVRQPSADRC